jgi:hypothetical protein
MAEPRPRTAARGRVSARATESGRDEQYDLLTAALIGVAVGVGATLLLQRASGAPRTIGSAMRVVGDLGGAALRRGSKRAREGMEDAGERVQEFLSEARERIDQTVDDELRGLRKALRRQRKRLGL